MLSYFESEKNVEDYLTRKFGKNDASDEARTHFAYTMRSAREYYTAVESVTLLTQPLLLFYGMSALSKGLFMATHGKKSPSDTHGLQVVDDFSPFENYEAEIASDGTFPQFHGCISKDSLKGLRFSTKERCHRYSRQRQSLRQSTNRNRTR
jgi:hypothetical protein